MQRIAVLGLLTFGLALVQALVQEQCQVLAVDLDENKVNMVRTMADEAVIADARDLRALDALRLHDYDVVVLSLGEPLDTSLLAALYLRDLQVGRIVAKAVSEDHRRLLHHLGVADIVFPEADMAQRLARTLSNPAVRAIFHLGEDSTLVEVTPPADMVGHTLVDLNLRHTYHVTVVAVRDLRGNEMRVNPDPHRPIADSEIWLALGRDEDIKRFAQQK